MNSRDSNTNIKRKIFGKFKVNHKTNKIVCKNDWYRGR